MRSWTQLFIFPLCSTLLLGSFSVYAEFKEAPLRVDERGTLHGYNPGGFCNSGAENMMAKLEEANKDKFEKLAQYKKQIEDLTTYDNVLAEVTKIQNDYINSVDNIAKSDPKSENALIENMDETKSIIRNGLTLSALSNLIQKQAATDNPETVSMGTLCKDIQDKAICKKNETEKIGYVAKPIYAVSSLFVKPAARPAQEQNYSANTEVHKLEKTLQDFQAVTQDLPPKDEKSLREEIKKIVNGIPQDIAPETLLASLDKDSPTVYQFLNTDITQQDMVNCLSKKNDKVSQEACTKIIQNPEDRKRLIDAISKENHNFSRKLKGYEEAIEVAKENNKDELEKSFESYDEKLKQNDAKAKESISDTTNKLVRLSQPLTVYNISKKETLRDMQLNRRPADMSMEENVKEKMLLQETDLNDIENFFYNRPNLVMLELQGIDMNTKDGALLAQEKQSKAIDNAKKDAAIFKRDCDFSGSVKKANESSTIQMCKGLVEKIIPQIKALRSSHIEEINALNVKIKNLASENNFAATENLKQYVAEKYLCSCERKKENIKTNYEESLTMSANSCKTEFMTLTKIEGLSDSTNLIAKALYAHEIKMPMDGAGCTFGPEKLKTFSDTCSNNSEINEKYKEICSSITNEYTVKIKDQEIEHKKTAKWEKYNEDNYVEYNSKSPTGYSAVKKKSNWRVVGEGVLPILPNALPIWFGNYQMKNNINTLTDQAMMQKQYLHNIDIYNSSPWMYNYNYFSYGNPFLTTTPLSTTTGPGGFNFGM